LSHCESAAAGAGAPAGADAPLGAAAVSAAGVVEAGDAGAGEGSSEVRWRILSVGAGEPAVSEWVREQAATPATVAANARPSIGVFELQALMPVSVVKPGSARTSISRCSAGSAGRIQVKG
jgi:hypothetical protein